MVAQKLVTTGTMYTNMSTESLDPKKHSLTYIEPKPTRRLKTNPLHLDSPYRSVKIPANRQTGHSTALGLKHISEAILRPYTWIEIIDHFGTIDANRNLAQMMKLQVHKLELKQIYFKQTNSNFYIAFGDPK